MVNASRNGQIGKTDALISLPAGEGDRSGASFKAFCFEMREAVAVVGVPIPPLFHHCMVNKNSRNLLILEQIPAIFSLILQPHAVAFFYQKNE